MFCISLKINPLETPISTYTTRLAPLSRQPSCVLSQAQQDCLLFTVFSIIIDVQNKTKYRNIVTVVKLSLDGTWGRNRPFYYHTPENWLLSMSSTISMAWYSIHSGFTIGKDRDI